MRIWADGSPFETKDVLKGRGFRWSGPRRCWYIDCAADQMEAELAFLQEKVFGRAVSGLPTQRITARDRFSVRTNPEAVQA